MGAVLGKVAQVTLSVAVPLGGGFAIGMWTAPEVKTWYKKIKKPTWNPPNWLFGPVWSVLYICQGIASWLVLQKGLKKNALALGLYAFQLLVNFAWNPLFFKAQRIDLALADIVALDVLVAATFAQFKDVIGLPTTAGLLGPYGAWISFATVLNAWILKNNPRSGEEAKPLLDEASSAAAAAVEAADKTAEAAAEAAGKAADKVEAAAKQTVEATAEATSKVADKVEETAQQVAETATDTTGKAAAAPVGVTPDEPDVDVAEAIEVVDKAEVEEATK